MSTITVPREMLSALIDMADDHVQDIESGIEDGTYDASDNKDIGKKKATVENAQELYKKGALGAWNTDRKKQ